MTVKHLMQSTNHTMYGLCDEPMCTVCDMIEVFRVRVEAELARNDMHGNIV